MKKKNISFYVAIVLSVLLSIVVITILVLWTKEIKRNKDEIEFIESLETYIEKDGIVNLLSKANIKVDNIYNTEKGLEIFVNSNYDKIFSIDEEINKKIYNNNKNSVVYITCEKGSNFSQGSGVIINKTGYILTNKHVLLDNSDEIYVYLSNDESKPAKLIGSDNDTDIALLKIESDNLEPVVIENSLLNVGQKVLSITNPRGFERSLSCGVVSGLNRPIRDISKGIVMDLIQTDVFVSKGSSGGALFNSKGNLIGIVTSIESKSGKYEGSAFAIPSQIILNIVPQLIENGYVKRGWVDFNFIPLDFTLKNYLKLDINNGLVVNEVLKNGKAYKAGLKQGSIAVEYMSKNIFIGGDIITHVNKTIVNNFNDFYLALSNTKPNDIIDFTVYRNNEYKDLKIELIERPKTVGIK